MQILAQVMNKVGTNTEQIKNELYNVQNYEGIADTYSFDANGDMSNANYEIKEFMNGQIIDAK
jgi:ABC-type branched-subunit amino acid transport system substrate-binding protein